MIGRMAERNIAFDRLRFDGLNAYAQFRALVTDPRALADWRVDVQPPQLDSIAAFTRVAATLPEPTEDLAFSVIASIAQHAGAGELREWVALMNAAGRPEASNLQGWLSAHPGELQLLVPEANPRLLLWTEHPEPFSLDLVVARAVRYATETSQQNFAGPISLLLVLLRDWSFELGPLLSELGFSVDTWIWDAATLAPKEEVRTDVWPDVVGRVNDMHSATGLRASPGLIFAAR